MRIQWLSSSFVMFMILLCNNCGGGGGNPDRPRGLTFDAEIAALELQAELDMALQQPGIVNAALQVKIPDYDFHWQNGVGVADPTTSEVMTADHPFRIASITKTFTATVVLQLVEARYFTLDTRLGDLLSAADLPGDFTVNDLHVFEDRPYGDKITVRQLLNHSSGMRDYILDSPDDAPDSLSIIELYIADLIDNESDISRKQWSAREILAYYLDSGMAQAPMNPPGVAYHYSDTNFVLLGLIIEKTMGTPLAMQYRSRLFEPLAMNASYLEWYEPAWGREIAHHFFDLTAIGGANVDLVAAGVNTSLDWGGGGLASTVGELNRFLLALMEGELFRSPTTLDELLATVNTDAGERYGLGIKEFEIDGVQLRGHSGFWGSSVYYLPQYHAAFALTVNQVASHGVLVEGVLRALRKARLIRGAS